jgi:C1A family cysteine protease
MVKLATVAFGICSAASVPPEVEQKFDEFQAYFGKNSVPEEREARLEIFAENLKRIETAQQNELGTAVYSHLTPFADLSPEEFAARKGLVRPDFDLEAETEELPATPFDAYDWRDHGAVNHVRDQKQCGSCWAFSVVANIEGAGFVETGKLVRLSEQQLVDCSKVDHGCGGGWPSKSMQYLIDNSMALEYHEDYHYTAKDGQCEYDKSLGVVQIAHWKAISTTAAGENQIAAALTQYGPLSIAMNAQYLQSYKGGITDPASCKGGQSKDHAITIVGFGSEGSKQYWTIRNSWGIAWGEDGYFRSPQGKNSCGLAEQVNTAYGITIDSSRPEPPEPTPGPNSCEAKGVKNCGDCQTLCTGHGGYNCRTPGPHCKCGDGKEGCEPFDPGFFMHFTV